MDQRQVEPMVDRLGREVRLFAEEIEETGESLDCRRDNPSLDARDRRLARASPSCELLLRYPVAAPSLFQNLTGSHDVKYI